MVCEALGLILVMVGGAFICLFMDYNDLLDDMDGLRKEDKE